MEWPPGWREITTIMGVINITPDSFSDGGKFHKPQDALKCATQHLRNGACVLDLGAQSTRPGAEIVGPAEELKRLLPALKAIRSTHRDTLISVDTFWSVVAEQAIKQGANWINDVSAGRHDPDIFKVVADAGCPFVLNHSRGDSLSMDSLASYNDVVNNVIQELLWQTESAMNCGISSEQLIWDPGLGFAKDTDHNLRIINGLENISQKGFPLLIGPSRKRFIGEILNLSDPSKRLMGTAAIVCRCVQANVSMVRVHDVREASETIAMASKLWPSK